MNVQPRPSYPFYRLITPLVLGFLGALALAMALANMWMGAPQKDIVDLVQYLLVSGAVSLGIGAAGVLWLRRGHLQLWLQLTLTFLFGVAAAIFNIYVTASLMFISEHDLPLLVLLLAFTATISIGLGYALARALAGRVAAISQGAQALAAGDLAARVPEQGDDELAQLARAFNRMADQLHASAAERERLEASRRNLFAAISHDLRTPLASLRVMTEALADGVVEDPATAARYLATMRGQIGQLNHLIDDLFEVARIDAGALKLDVQKIAPALLISDAVDGLQPQAAEKGITLRGETMPDTPPVLIAPQQIARVLANILSNAIRHTPGGGTITLCAKAQANAVAFEIADSGEGIAPEDLPHIFERFYRGEKSRSRVTGGAGLGLTIARGIVEAHGGSMSVESAPGSGTQVRFTVPVAETTNDERRKNETLAFVVRLSEGGIMSGQPPRLANEAFMSPHDNLRVYRFANTHSVGLHWHEFYELMLVTGGTGMHYLNGVSLPLLRGSFCLLSPSDFHEVAPICGQTLEFWNIIFTDALLSDTISELIFGTASAYHVEVEQTECTWLDADCQRLWEETNDRRLGYQIVAQATLDRLLIALRRSAANPPAQIGQAAPEPVRRALRFIQRHFREPLTLGVVAEQARLSPAYFSDSFRRATGQTFQLYLQQQRLQFARSLLTASDLPISEICHAAGFNSLSHFVRVFKHQIGMPPRDYRQQKRAAGMTENSENGAHFLERFA